MKLQGNVKKWMCVKNSQPKVWQSFIGRTRMDQHNFVPVERIDNGKGHWQEEQETAIQIQILG